MPVDENLLLYSLANTFSTTLGIPVCDQTKSYLKSNAKVFNNCSTEDKMYYAKYAIALSNALSQYLDDIIMFEINTEEEHTIEHQFRLKWGNDYTAYICLFHKTINVQNIIPQKLMKICKYKKNSNVGKYYYEHYDKINAYAHKKLQNKKKYSELTDKQKTNIILKPICELVMNTISKKRKQKHVKCLYDHLFKETDRLVLRLYKTRFTIYDFGKKTDEITSYKMKQNSDNEIVVTFNNGAEFVMTLHTNATDIKECLSVKFRTNFKNLDEIFGVSNGNVL